MAAPLPISDGSSAANFRWQLRCQFQMAAPLPISDGSSAANFRWQLRCQFQMAAPLPISDGSSAAGAKSGRLMRSAHKRAGRPARKLLTANTQPFDQLLVTTIVGAPQIIENLAPLRHELEQAAPRMVVLYMRLEVFRQIVDPLRKERNLDLRRACVTGFGGVSFDHFRFTRGRYRHRHQPLCLAARPAMPVKLNTRRGTISPRSTSAMANSWPLEATWTMPRKMEASRPRNNTAWPLASLAASAGLTASAGMSSSAVSIGRSVSARCPSPAAALWHKASTCSRGIMSPSPKGPTQLRRKAETCPSAPSARPRSLASDRT